MDIGDVMDQIAAQADTIEGLNCYAYPPDAVVPPAAVMDYPDDYTFDETYGRGMDRMTLPLYVVVGKLAERATRDVAAAFLNGNGVASIKQVIESGTYTAFHTVRVTGVEKEPATIANEDYLAYRFDLDVVGQGTAGS